MHDQQNSVCSFYLLFGLDLATIAPLKNKIQLHTLLYILPYVQTVMLKYNVCGNTKLDLNHNILSCYNTNNTDFFLSCFKVEITSPIPYCDTMVGLMDEDARCKFLLTYNKFYSCFTKNYCSCFKSTLRKYLNNLFKTCLK